MLPRYKLPRAEMKFKIGDKVKVLQSDPETAIGKVGTITRIEGLDKRPYKIDNLFNGQYWEFSEHELELIQGASMSVRESAKKLRETIRPYDKYIIAAAVLLVLDHFVFKGELSGKIKELCHKLSNKLLSTLDGLIGRL